MVPGFGMKRYVSSNKYMAYPKAYRLEISGPGLRLVVIYMRPVRTHFHVPGEIANNGYAKVLGGGGGVLWGCASSE